MEYIESFFLNLVPGGSTPACHVSQYDKGRTIRANLIKGSTAYSIKNGDVFTLNIKKPDGNIVTATVEATEGNTYIDFSTTEQMCAVKGNNICEFSIENDADLIGTANFLMIIEASPLEGGIESKSEIENLTTQIEDIVEDVVPEVLGDDYYNKEQSDERFATSAAIKEPLNLADAIITNNDINPLNWVEGNYINPSNGELVRDNNYITTEYIPVTPNMRYVSFKTNHFAWYNENKIFISGSNVVVNEAAPYNAKYIRVDFTKTNKSEAFFKIGYIAPFRTANISILPVRT